MTISSFQHPLNSLFIPIFAMSLFLAALFVAGCGDEGDTSEDTSGGMTNVLQPAASEPVNTPVEDPVVVAPVEEEEAEEVARVSFADDIQPILEARCATPGCHVAPGAAGLDLSNYDSFKDSGVFDVGDGDGSLVVRRIDGGGMPPGGPPLDDDQIQLFIDWIDEGAEDN